MALPPGVNGKTLTFGTTTGFDGITVPDGSRVVITTSKNVKHIASGRQLVAGQIVRKYVSGIATFDELVPNDAPGLDRYDWTYTVRFEIAGANESPESFSFVLFNNDPQTIDGDLLSPVPSSIGTPVSVNALRLPPGGVVGQALVFTADFGVAWASLQPAGDYATHGDVSTATAAVTLATTQGLATKVNSSTYTAGLAAKQDVATLDAATAAAVTAGGSATASAIAADATVRAAFGSGGSLTPTATKTAPYTVAVGELAVMNVPGGATALALPTAPADKDKVGFLAVGATTAVPLVVTRGGTDTIGTAGATSVTAPLSGEVTIYQYQASGTRWLPIANVKPLTALDARYAAGSTSAAPTAWAAATAYALAQQVTYRGRTYAAKSAHTSGSVFNPANWTLLSGAVQKRGVIVPAGALTNWQTARDASATTAAEVAVFGDSTSFGSSDATRGGYAYWSWVQALRLRATQAGVGPYLDGGRGVTAGVDSVDINLAFPDVISNLVSRTGFNAASGQNGVRLTDEYVSTTAGDVVTYQGKGTKVRVDYVGGGAYGQFSVSVDGAAAVVVNPPLTTSAAGALTNDSITFAGLAEGTHTVAITNNGGQVIVPSVAAPNIGASNSGGSLTAGTFYYKTTGVTTAGETTVSPAGQGTTAGGSGSITVTPRLIAGATSYNIYRSTTSGGTYGLIGNVAASGSGAFNGTAFTDTGGTAPGVVPPSTNTAGLNAASKTVAASVEFLRDSGLVFHKFATSGISYNAYFDYTNPTWFNSNAAVALGLDPQAASVNGYGWGLPKKSGANGRNVKAAICALGINNLNFASAPAAMSNISDVIASIGAYAENFVRMTRAAGADPILVIPHADLAVGPHWYAGALRTALTSVALSHQCVLVDFAEALGPPNTHASQGFGSGNVANPHIGKGGYDLEGAFMWDEVLSV